ncbi:MAG: putative TonB-dependent receptor BfrD precursor, partial [Pseudomonadota bacterium]
MAFKPTLLPVAAAIMTLGLQAQSAAQTDKDQKLSTVKVEAAEETSSNSVRATETTIGKGRQALRDIPQSVTVLTERLIDDRNLDTVKEALRNTAGVTFLAAEGGEEDVRLRGFSLQATGDLFVDGMRDPAIYDRDTFNLDRLEVLRGSASMLFGRGSTGGAVNQVNKQPQLWDSNQLDITLGEHNYRRVVADLNKRVGERSGLRVTAMNTQADNNGSGSALDKHGIAATLGLGIGEQNEFEVSAYRLQNNNGVNYGMPFIPPVLGSTDRELLPVDPASYFGLASDYNDSSADIFTVGHTYRFSVNSELKTRIRQGHFERDLRSGAIRLNTTQPHGVGASLETLSDATILTRGTHIKVQEMDNLHVQSDFSNKFKLHNMEHQLLAGADFSREEKTVFAARNAAQGGVNITKPTTTVGTPNDGAFVDEASRVLRVNNTYVSTGFGAYIQDLVQVAPHWKLLGGLRYDSLKGDYQTYTLSATNPSGPVIPSDFYDMDVSEF